MSVWKFLLWLSLVLFGGFATIIFVLVVALDGPSCGEESPSVALARGLTAPQLAHLYERMSALSEVEFNPPLNEYYFDEVPIEFAYLNAKKVRPHRGNIMLEGCFDHYVYLDFPGVGSARPPQDGSERAVVLSYNEWPVKSEVLWSE